MILLIKLFVSKSCLDDLSDSESSLEDQILTNEDFAVPGPDRVRIQSTYDTDWRQKPPVPPRRGKHYNTSTGENDEIKSLRIEFCLVGPSIQALTYPPTIFLGRLFRLLWGEMPIWEVRQWSIDIDLYLPLCLHPVPLPTLTDHIKHQTLCAKPIIWLVRRSQVQAHPLYRLADKDELLKEILVDHKYNFVLLGDGRLVFARIPHIAPKCPYRLLTKHVGLAKRSSNVRFAGELKKADDNETLLLNNNSGTYRPDDKLVPIAVAYLQRLFPQISIGGIPRK